MPLKLTYIIAISLLNIACSFNQEKQKPKQTIETKTTISKDTLEIEDVETDDFGADAPPQRTQWSNNKLISTEWFKLDSGLFYTETDASIHTNFGDNKISILQIDPEFYEFNIESSKENMSALKTARSWADDKGLIAVFNAGMFKLDGEYSTNVGYMKDQGFINNPNFSNQNAYFSFNPSDTTIPKVKIIDTSCDNKWSELKKYNSVTQSIRMLSCKQENVWSQQKKYWSMVVVGSDNDGNILFLFTRSPYSVHDFINMIIKLDIGIQHLAE